MEHGFDWVALLPGVGHLPSHMVTGALVAIIVALVAMRARRGLDTSSEPLLPDGRATPRDLFDVITSFVHGMAEGLMGHHGREYVPLLASFFTFILFSNLIGLIPGFTPPTDSFSTTLGLGIVSFLSYNYFGLKAHGVGYLKHFLGPIIWLAPLMVVVELMSHVFRPVSLALRLYGNMFADHMVLGIFTDLTKVVVPVIFYALGAFVCVVQAFVFTALSMVYISSAIAHDH